jgi:hypothetical protein
VLSQLSYIPTRVPESSTGFLPLRMRFSRRPSACSRSVGALAGHGVLAPVGMLGSVGVLAPVGMLGPVGVLALRRVLARFAPNGHAVTLGHGTPEVVSVRPKSFMSHAQETGICQGFGDEWSAGHHMTRLGTRLAAVLEDAVALSCRRWPRQGESS